MASFSCHRGREVGVLGLPGWWKIDLAMGGSVELGLLKHQSGMTRCDKMSDCEQYWINHVSMVCYGLLKKISGAKRADADEMMWECKVCDFSYFSVTRLCNLLSFRWELSEPETILIITIFSNLWRVMLCCDPLDSNCGLYGRRQPCNFKRLPIVWYRFW